MRIDNKKSVNEKPNNYSFLNNSSENSGVFKNVKELDKDLLLSYYDQRIVEINKALQDICPKDTVTKEWIEQYWEDVKELSAEDTRNMMQEVNEEVDLAKITKAFAYDKVRSLREFAVSRSFTKEDILDIIFPNQDEPCYNYLFKGYMFEGGEKSQNIKEEKKGYNEEYQQLLQECEKILQSNDNKVEDFKVFKISLEDEFNPYFNIEEEKSNIEELRFEENSKEDNKTEVKIIKEEADQKEDLIPKNLEKVDDNNIETKKSNSTGFFASLLAACQDFTKSMSGNMDNFN